MFLALDTHEQEIAAAAAGFLRQEFPLERLHKQAEGPLDTSATVRAFAELGWLGLSAPEAIGGSGLGVVEQTLFFLELGRVAGPVEVLAQILAVAVAQDERAIAADLMVGSAAVALLVENNAAGDIRFIGGADSRYALWVTPTGAALYELKGSDCTAVPCLDRSVQMYTGRASVLVPRVAIAGESVWCKALVATAAMLLGVAECALAMIVEYAKVRQTFGRAIGAYQAVRHPCADMAVRVEAARCQLFYAATALQEQQPDAMMQVDAARLLAQKAATANTDANIQLHGGIGVTDEHSAHLLLKRANLLWRLFGSSRQSMQSLLADSGNAAAGHEPFAHGATAVEAR